jgi:hypothetical protein
VVASGVDARRCRIDFEPTPRQRAAIARAARYYDYLAWLFNERQVAIGSAQNYAAKGMLEMYDLAAFVFTLPAVQQTYPELRRFKLQRGTESSTDPCADAP